MADHTPCQPGRVRLFVILDRPDPLAPAPAKYWKGATLTPTTQFARGPVKTVGTSVPAI
jgi:hypothetical protein